MVELCNLRATQATIGGTSRTARSIAQVAGTATLAYGLSMAVVEAGCFAAAFGLFSKFDIENNFPIRLPPILPFQVQNPCKN